MSVIRCKECGEAISVRSQSFGTKIPKSVTLKPVTSEGLDKKLCEECERKSKG